MSEIEQMEPTGPVEYLDRRPDTRTVGQWEPSVFDRLLSFIAQQALVGGLDPTTLALFFDISHWNGDFPTTAIAKTAMLGAKLSDGKQVIKGNVFDLNTYKDDWADRNVQKAYDLGRPCMLYHYVQPMIPEYKLDHTIKWQLDIIYNALRNKRPGVSFHAFALDVEELTASPNWGSDVVLGMLNELLSAPALGGVPIVIYTSNNVLNYYIKLREQISYPGANRNLWLAQWAYNNKVTTWDNLITNIVPTLNMRVPTPGSADWRMLQWGVFGINGLPGAVDLNFYKGTKDQLYSWLNYKTTTTPPVDPPQPPTDDDNQQQGEYATVEQMSALQARVTTLEAKLNAVKGVL